MNVSTSVVEVEAAFVQGCADGGHRWGIAPPNILKFARKLVSS